MVDGNKGGSYLSETFDSTNSVQRGNLFWEALFSLESFLLYLGPDILATIHGDVFPWQPDIIGNKTFFY